MFTIVHLLSPAISLLFAIAAFAVWRQMKGTVSVLLLGAGIVALASDVFMHGSFWLGSGGVDPDSGLASIMAVNGWLHVGAYFVYAVLLIMIAKRGMWRQGSTRTDAESGRREILTPAPHTTGHTGP